jgi:hypothetical protein
VNEASPSGNDERPVQEIMGRLGAPAYIRRARQVEDAYQALLARCRTQRDEWLGMVRLRIGQLFALARGPEGLRPLLADDSQLALLSDLHASLAPVLRVPLAPTQSQRELRTAFRELVESMERFNRRWDEFLLGVDVAPLNALRDKYNRYYLLEKECALRGAPAARQRFVPLTPLTHAELRDLFPLLPVPRLCRGHS